MKTPEKRRSLFLALALALVGACNDSPPQTRQQYAPRPAVEQPQYAPPPVYQQPVQQPAYDPAATQAAPQPEQQVAPAVAYQAPVQPVGDPCRSINTGFKLGLVQELVITSAKNVREIEEKVNTNPIYSCYDGNGDGYADTINVNEYPTGLYTGRFEFVSAPTHQVLGNVSFVEEGGLYRVRARYPGIYFNDPRYFYDSQPYALSAWSRLPLMSWYSHPHAVYSVHVSHPLNYGVHRPVALYRSNFVPVYVAPAYRPTPIYPAAAGVTTTTTTRTTRIVTPPPVAPQAPTVARPPVAPIVPAVAPAPAKADPNKITETRLDAYKGQMTNYQARTPAQMANDSRPTTAFGRPSLTPPPAVQAPRPVAPSPSAPSPSFSRPAPSSFGGSRPAPSPAPAFRPSAPSPSFSRPAPSSFGRGR